MPYSQAQPDSVRSLFGTIAPGYDRANALISLGLYKRWNQALIDGIPQENTNSLLDLCAGTGEIGLQLATKSCKVTFLDFCEEMLEEAKKKAPFPIETKVADACQLPFEKESFDAATIAYGIRNVQSPALCIEETYRVLRPGATFGILELTRPKNHLLRLGHQFHLRFGVPLLGQIVTGNGSAYRYLSRTISNFMTAEEIASLLEERGFHSIRIRKFLGGVASVIHCLR